MEVKRGRGRPKKDDIVITSKVEDTITTATIEPSEVKKGEKESKLSAERKSEENYIGWRITGNFRHPRTGVCYGIGEGVPEDLTNDEKELLYINQKLAKITASGQIVAHKKWIILNKDQIKNLLQSPANIVKTKIMAINLHKDTLGEMFKMANQIKVSPEILQVIELKLEQI